ncbi:Major facilitator superfamily transporter protein [Rutstroemia sp. NJR-2017a BBW]|nr:Major facilitator superfamily transporter protein [Rutstroemia sp. NJR-2017a BBW]
MSLYTCSHCNEEIRANRVRVECCDLACENPSDPASGYHLCADCFVVGDYHGAGAGAGGAHEEGHQTRVVRESGTVRDEERDRERERERERERSRSRARGEDRSKEKIEVPTANWGALWDIVKPKGGRRGDREREKKQSESSISIGSNSTVKGGSAGSVGFEVAPMSTLRPVLPPRPKLKRSCSSFAAVKRPSVWEPLFAPDESQNVIFGDLMAVLFARLDKEELGLLSPEVWSGYLDVQGVPMEENNQEIADLELGIYYTSNEISHVLHVRQKPDLSLATGGSEEGAARNSSEAGKRIRRSICLGANMPMLTPQGFADVNAMMLLEKPDEGCKRLRELLRAYGIWKELGEFPRECLPARAIVYGKRKSLLEMSLEKEMIEAEIIAGLQREAIEEMAEIEDDESEAYEGSLKSGENDRFWDKTPHIDEIKIEEGVPF